MDMVSQEDWVQSFYVPGSQRARLARERGVKQKITKTLGSNIAGIISPEC